MFFRVIFQIIPGQEVYTSKIEAETSVNARSAVLASLARIYDLSKVKILDAYPLLDG